MNKNDLVFNNYIYDSCISPCCYDYSKKISINIDEDMIKTYNNILSILSIKNDFTEQQLKNKYPDCYYCPYRNLPNKNKNPKIDFVNLSLYPSPCQCNCFYCDIRKNKKMMTYKSVDLKQYEFVFEVLNQLIKNNFIFADTRWQVSCGEITIHPLKNQIYNFTKNKNVTYYTNCCTYDQELENILSSNINSRINFSIDCGNSPTWSKIKGLNNFNQVISNLEKYIHHSTPKQIELKYILLTDINDDNKNFNDIINIMQKNNLNKIIITRNYDIEITEALIKAKDRFIQLLTKNNIDYELTSF